MNDYAKCEVCGGDVLDLEVSGRQYFFEPGVSEEIPADAHVPTCEKCLTIYPNLDEARELERRLLPLLLAKQATHVGGLVRILCGRHSAAHKSVAAVCAVTPSFLSNVIAGKKRASATFVRFAEALVACPSEFERHVDGRAFRVLALVHNERESWTVGQPTFSSHGMLRDGVRPSSAARPAPSKTWESASPNVRDRCTA